MHIFHTIKIPPFKDAHMHFVLEGKPAQPDEILKIMLQMEELKILCSESKERNLEVACHVNGDSAIKNAAEAGVSSIEHGYFVSNETLHMMKDKNIRWTPTAFALLTYSLMLLPAERRHIEGIIENHLASINYAVSIGVKLNIGTDSGSVGVKHGNSFFDELQLFQKAGLSLEQILAAACIDDMEIKKENYLIVKNDFIKTKKIKAVFSQIKKSNDS